MGRKFPLARGCVHKKEPTKRLALFILFSQLALNEFDDLHHGNHQEGKAHSNAVLSQANGSKAKGAGDEGHFDDQGGQQQGAQHSCPQNLILGLAAEDGLALRAQVERMEDLTHAHC